MAHARIGSALAALALAAALAAGCGDEPAATTATGPAPERDPAPPATGPGGEDGGEPAPAPPEKPSGPAESGFEDPRQTATERRAARTVRRYVAGLDARDGRLVCSLLAEGAIEAVRLPERRGGCADSLAASIGYRDPRGLPVWEGAELTGLRFERLGGATATAIATVQTRFADRDEVSVEDDVVYLVRAGGRWLIAKPSSTLYRAIGIADVPPAVLSPP